MPIEDIKKGSEEAVELLLQRAKRLVGTVHDFHERTKKGKEAGRFFESRPAVLSDITGEVHALEDAINRYEHGVLDPERIPYKTESVKRYSGDEFREDHESFGLVSFHRVSGATRLFGSHLDHHNHYITLSVMRATVSHGLSSDHYYERNTLIEVDMSAAQYAEAITTMNMGGGIPCTIRRINHIRMEDVPEDTQAEYKKIRDGFKDQISDLVDMAKNARTEAKEIVDGKSAVSKTRVRQIVAVLDRVVMELESNAPFVVKQFEESADRVVTHAKAEVESFVMHALTKVGLKAIAGEYKIPVLGDGEDHE
jgi:hypothetical protein